MLRHSPRTVQRVWLTAIACGMVLGVGCERTPEAAAPKTTVQSERKVPSLRPEAIGAKPPTTPWIAHVFPVDLDRDDAHAHIAFNVGPHRCIGSHLARLELRVFWEEWLRRIPTFRHDSDRPAVFRAGLTLAVQDLGIRWD